MAVLVSNQIGPEGDKTVWHYTDGSGFLGIIRTKSIWASSAIFLNDSAEISEAFNVARKLAREDKLGEVELACLELALSKAGNPRGLGALNHLGAFVASFSNKCDDLSQWRSYGNGTGGSYCLGFAPSLLNRVGGSLGFSLEKVEYDESAQKALMKPVVNQLMTCVETLDLTADTLLAQKGTWPLRDVPAELAESVRTFAKDIRLIAPRIKNAAFASEEEWRMIRTSTEISGTIKFRATDTGLIPYVPIEFPETDFSLRGVVVGPSPRQDKNFAAAAWALGANSLGCTTSDIPFRNW
jgi:hypothetical protein